MVTSSPSRSASDILLKSAGANPTPTPRSANIPITVLAICCNSSVLSRRFICWSILVVLGCDQLNCAIISDVASYCGKQLDWVPERMLEV